jgi:hypothetical protein
MLKSQTVRQKSQITAAARIPISKVSNAINVNNRKTRDQWPGKQKMAALAAKAKRLGLSPASYVKQLVEEDLTIESDAQSMTLAQSWPRFESNFAKAQ